MSAEVSGKGAAIPEFRFGENHCPVHRNSGKDGDILSLGAGVAVENLAQMGIFDKKNDLGYWRRRRSLWYLQTRKAGIMTVI